MLNISEHSDQSKMIDSTKFGNSSIDLREPWCKTYNTPFQ